MTLQAVLLDLDGTAVDTEELHRQAFNQAFLRLELRWEWDRDTYAALLAVSGGPDRLARHIDGLDLPAAEKTRLRRIVPALHAEKTRIYGEILAGDRVRLRPGVGRLVEEARRAGLSVGLAATSAAANVEPLVAAAFGREGRDAIRAIVTVQQVARRKPAPDIYELLLATLGVPAAAAAAFEDSANGVAAAKAAGLLTVATPSRWTRGQDFAAADLVLDSLGEPGAPLAPVDAARIGGASCLGLAQLEALRLAAAGPRATTH
ncbi:MAG: HAD-IA family hydrolase [Dongiaceae bacterium]